jgi:hypothetical protein
VENADALVGQTVSQVLPTKVLVTYDRRATRLPGPLHATDAECNDTLHVEPTRAARPRRTYRRVLAGAADGPPVRWTSTPRPRRPGPRPPLRDARAGNVATYDRQLDLTIKDLAIDDSRNSSASSPGAPLPTLRPLRRPFAPNTAIKAGESFTACVKFVSDSLGGTFTPT